MRNKAQQRVRVLNAPSRCFNLSIHFDLPAIRSGMIGLNHEALKRALAHVVALGAGVDTPDVSVTINSQPAHTTALLDARRFTVSYSGPGVGDGFEKHCETRDVIANYPMLDAVLSDPHFVALSTTIGADSVSIDLEREPATDGDARELAHC